VISTGWLWVLGYITIGIIVGIIQCVICWNNDRYNDDHSTARHIGTFLGSMLSWPGVVVVDLLVLAFNHSDFNIWE